MQIHLNKTLCWLKKYVLFSCHLGWMNRSRFCLPSQKSYRVFPLLGCISKRLWTSQKKYHQSVESEVLAFSTSLSHSQTATGALWVFGCVGNDVSAAAAAAAATIGLRVSIITLIIYSWRRRRATNCYRCQYYTPPCCLLLSFPTIFYLCSPRPLVILLFFFHTPNSFSVPLLDFHFPIRTVNWRHRIYGHNTFAILWV